MPRDETDGITQPGWRLQHIVANFNGDRNVRATLQTADNSLVRSILAPPRASRALIPLQTSRGNAARGDGRPASGFEEQRHVTA